jgi:fluoroquinolone transport system permease protein
MTRLLHAIRYDAVLQWRNGFIAAALVITGLWALLLSQAQGIDLRWLMPPMLAGNLLVGTFFFISGLILLEKDERVTAALRVSPLRQGEYLAAKVVTLAAPALVETLVIAGLASGWRFDALLLLAGTLLAAAIYCLAGAIAVARYSAINAYLIPAGGYAALLWIPLLAYMVGWDAPLMIAHPLGGPLMLLTAAFDPAPLWEIGLALISGAGWIVALGAWACRS